MTSINFEALYQEERKKAFAQIKKSNKKNSESSTSSKPLSDDGDSSIFRKRIKKIDLLNYKLDIGIDSIYYIGEFISIEEEKALVDAIYRDDDDDGKKELNYGEKKSWVSLSKRRLKNLGGGM